jgi:hypothetical protein
MLVLGWGCDQDEDAMPASLLPASFPGGFSVVRDCRFSVEHDSVYIRIFADAGAAPVYEDASYPFATGARVVKEEYRDSTCTDVTGWTVMHRLDDAQMAADPNWTWQRLDEMRVPIGPETPETCASCHRACTEGRDGVCADP